MAQEIETREKAEADPESSKYWEMELDSAKTADKEYRDTAARLIKLYEGKGDGAFNIFWSNVEVLKPVVYSQRPQPDVRQRKEIKDPVGRDVAMVLERAVRYSCDNRADYDFDEEVEAIRDEMLITGRGVPWVNYKPYLVDVDAEFEEEDPDTGDIEIVTDTVQELADQNAWAEAINYDDFLASPAKRWGKVRWVARRHTPNRDECIKQFGEHGQEIPLNYSILTDKYKETKEGREDVFKRAIIWEIWDKEKRQRVWFAEGYKYIVKREEDPYKLEGFFPLPKPLYSFMIPGTLKPVSEYEIYKTQVVILNEATEKINELTSEIMVKGAYSGLVDAVAQLAAAGNGELIPVNDLGGTVSMKDAIAWWPIEQIASALVQLYQTRTEAIQTIYQVTGISDIIRGSTNAKETATAQQIKGNFAQLRLQPRQQPMQRMLRDIFRIKAELIAEHYTPEILQQITGIEVTAEMLAVMRNDKLRNLTVDFETDSTVKADEDSDKQRRTEFLQALMQMLKELIPAAQTGAIPPDLAKALLSFGVRGFKIGRELEDALDQLGEQPPQQQPDPEAQKAQAEMQLEQQRMQMEGQSKQAELQIKQQSEFTKAQLEGQKLQIQSQAQSAELQQEMQLEQLKLQNEMQLEKYKADMEMELAKYKAEMDADIKLQVAELTAQAHAKQMEARESRADNE